jgi:hypothetical protein
MGNYFSKSPELASGLLYYIHCIIVYKLSVHLLIASLATLVSFAILSKILGSDLSNYFNSNANSFLVFRASSNSFVICSLPPPFDSLSS